jgi:hypothetical protein
MRITFLKSPPREFFRLKSPFLVDMPLYCDMSRVTPFLAPLYLLRLFRGLERNAGGSFLQKESQK